MATQITLLINASSEAKLDVFLCADTKHIASKSMDGDFKVSEHLLKLIDSLLKDSKHSLSDVTCIGVITGPGPFTSLRIAVSIANTLSYTLQIPVVGISLEEMQGVFNVDNSMEIMNAKLPHIKAGELVVPVYGKEPNIS